MTNGQEIDWEALGRLRSGFLNGTAGQRDYWQSERDLASYDATFAQRIGWKWDYVLTELKRRGWLPPRGNLLDWGCGSGVAGRAFVDHFGASSVSQLSVWDRSPLAMSFAARSAREKYPGLSVATGLVEPANVVLMSHVLTELTPEELDRLVTWVTIQAHAVLWVEPGTHDASRRLISIRERLRERMSVIAPCTHQQFCGMLAADKSQHWCHHFATAPPEVFTDPNWGKFAHLTGIDLRALPMSFLVLDRRPTLPLPEESMRIIGRPRVQKPYALVFGCDASGVCDYRLSKRSFPELYRAAKKGELDPLQVSARRCNEILTMRPLLE